MALNSMGLGFLFTAKDLASGTMRKLEKNFNGLDNASDEASKKMATNTKRMATGLGLMAAGAVGLRVLGSTVGEARQFGKAIGEVSTLVDEATFSTDKMRKMTMELSEQFGADSLQQSAALYQTISSGITDAEGATKLLTVANKLAIAGATDLTTGVDGLTSAMKAYSADGLTAEDASDSLFTAMRLGKTTVGELSKTLGRVAPVAQSMGISFAELTTAVSAITLKGIKTSEAVSGLKASIANIVKPTKDAKDEAKRLGIQFDSAALRAKGLKGFMDSVTGSAKFNKDSISKLFGSIEAFNAITALTADNQKNFNDGLQESAKRAGATTKALAAMSKEAKFDLEMKKLSASFKNFKILIGEALIPVLLILIGVFKTIFNAFNSLPGPVRTVIAVGLALAFAMAFLGGMAIFAVAALSAFKTLGLAATFLKMGGAVKTFAFAFGRMVIGVVAGFIQMAIAAIPLLIAMLPIILVILAIAAAIALVIIFWDELQAAAVFAIGVIHDVLKFLFKLMVKQIKFVFKIWKTIFMAMVKVVQVLWGVVKTIVGAIKDAFVTVADTIVSVWNGIVNALTPVFDFIRGIIQGILDFINFVVEKVEWLVNKAKEAGSFIADVGGGVFDFVTETVNPFSDDFLELPGSGGGEALAPLGGGGGVFEVVRAQQQAQQAKQAQTINLTSNTVVDGEVVGSVTKKFLVDEQTRSFGPSGEDD